MAVVADGAIRVQAEKVVALYVVAGDGGDGRIAARRVIVAVYRTVRPPHTVYRSRGVATAVSAVGGDVELAVRVPHQVESIADTRTE